MLCFPRTPQPAAGPALEALGPERTDATKGPSRIKNKQPSCRSEALHSKGKLQTKVGGKGGNILAGLIKSVRVVVVALPARIKHERHQAAADRQRHHHTTDDGEPAVERDRVAAEVDPGGAGEPERSGQHGEQGCNEENAHGSDIGEAAPYYYA